MALNLNKFVIAGNLTRDPELVLTSGGKPVVTLNIAQNFSYKDKDDNKKEGVNYLQVKVWGKTAESAAEFLKKGSGVYTEGFIRNNNYESDGKTVYQNEFVADVVTYL